MERISVASVRGFRLGSSNFLKTKQQSCKFARQFSSLLSQKPSRSNCLLHSNSYKFAMPVTLKFSTLSESTEKTEFADFAAPATENTEFAGFAAPGSESISDVAEGAVSAVEAITAEPVTHWKNVEAAMTLLSGVRDVTGLPWWVTIILTTAVVRTMMIPLIIKQFKVAAVLGKMKPELEEANEEFKRAKAAGEVDHETLLGHQAKTLAIMKKYGANPLQAFITPLVSGPIFMTFFFTLRAMPARYPSFEDGGALWFTNLGVMDQYYILPCLSAASFLVVIELGTEGGQASNQMSTTMKNIFRSIAVTTPLFVYTFPSAVFMYWITSNFYSLIQGKILKSPWGKKTFDIPDLQAPSPLDSNPYLKKKVKKEKKASIPEASTQPITYFDDVKSDTTGKKKKTRRR